MFRWVSTKSTLLFACRTIGDHSCLYGWGATPMQTPRPRRQPAIKDVPPRPGPKTATVRTIPNSRLRTTCFIASSGRDSLCYTRERRRPLFRVYFTGGRLGSIFVRPVPLFTSMIWSQQRGPLELEIGRRALNFIGAKQKLIYSFQRSASGRFRARFSGDTYLACSIGRGSAIFCTVR